MSSIKPFQYLRLLLAGTVLMAMSSCTGKAEPYSNANGEQIFTESVATAESRAVGNDEISNTRQNGITRAARECSPAIVGINVTEMREVNTNPFGGFFFDNDPFMRDFMGRFNQKYTQKVQSLGSGFLISSDGYIITNDHVAGKASKVVVTMTNGEKYDAEIIGSDATSDVTLLKINGKNFPYLKLGNSDDVLVGEWAIAFGNPFGLFDKNAKPTVTVGVVSNMGVSFSENSESVNGKRIYRNMIQTDAAISSGNSGGPLVNANGDVIGVNTVIFSTAQSYKGAGSIGIGFSIPINRVKKIINQLKAGEKFDREFYTGLTVDFLNEQNKRYYGATKSEGVIVTGVMTNSPAQKAGIEPGDVVQQIDGVNMHSNDDVDVAINDGVVGQTLTFKIERDGEILTKKLTLEKRRR